jgi:apolipoprotein N-acyltransferase
VRCTNNGLTCWIDALGRMHDVYFAGSQNIYQAGYKVVEVPLRAPNAKNRATFYRRHGDWFGWGCVGAMAISLACTLGRKVKNKGRVRRET